jgi:hypothetical protein
MKRQHDDDLRSAICYGNAGPNDYHLAADIVAVDGDIVAWLEQRERRRPSLEHKRKSAALGARLLGS